MGDFLKKNLVKKDQVNRLRTDHWEAITTRAQEGEKLRSRGGGGGGWWRGWWFNNYNTCQLLCNYPEPGAMIWVLYSMLVIPSYRQRH